MNTLFHVLLRSDSPSKRPYIIALKISPTSQFWSPRRLLLRLKGWEVLWSQQIFGVNGMVHSLKLGSRSQSWPVRPIFNLGVFRPLGNSRMAQVAPVARNIRVKSKAFNLSICFQNIVSCPADKFFGLPVQNQIRWHPVSERETQRQWMMLVLLEEPDLLVDRSVERVKFSYWKVPGKLSWLDQGFRRLRFGSREEDWWRKFCRKNLLSGARRLSTEFLRMDAVIKFESKTSNLLNSDW